MQSQELTLDSKISSFLHRKHAEFPELAVSGHMQSRTVKHAAALRRYGQVLMVSHVR